MAIDDNAKRASYIPMMVSNLQPNQVHLWFLDWEEQTFGALRHAAERLVPPEEFVKSRNFLNERAGGSYLITRAFVRTVLSQYADVTPRSWKFHYNAYGKPEIAAPAAARSLRFNLAHTDGLVACAIAVDRDIGVDAEAIDRVVEMEEIASQYFAASEAAALKVLSPDDRRCRFFEWWTLKEAYLKARGLGLSLPLDKFVFSTEAKAAIEVVFDRNLAVDQRDWQFSLLRPTTRHQVAVAVAGRLQEEQGSWRAEIELVIKPFEERVYEAAMANTPGMKPWSQNTRRSPMRQDPERHPVCIA